MLERAVRATVFGQVLLMIFFGPIKNRRWFDLGDDGATKTPALVQLCKLGFSRRFLRRRMIKNNRTILRTKVGSLTIASRWIMVPPENVEQLIVGNFCGIERHLDDFRMTRFVAAHILIGWIFGCAPGITDDRILHSLGLPEDRFHAPETARSESRFFRAHIATMKRERIRRNLCLTNPVKLFHPDQFAGAVAAIFSGE